jgi:hypothetical protein
MTLLEIVDAYQGLLLSEGRALADLFLGQVGAHPAVQRAIRGTFTDSGQRRSTCG